MKKEIIQKKLVNVCGWINKAREEKNWKEYQLMTKEYMRLLNLMKEGE